MIACTSSKLLASMLFITALLGVLTMQAGAQEAIFSFEEDLQGWASPSGVALAQSSFGATDGTMAMLIDNLTPGYKNDIATTGNFGPATTGFVDAFQAFALAGSVIANGGTPKLEFDLAWDFSAATTGFIQMGLIVNSSNDPIAPVDPGGYRGYGTGSFINGNSGFASWPALGAGAIADGVTLTMTSPTSAHVSVPFAPSKAISISNPSTFYNVILQSNGNWTGTVDFAVDNMKFTGVPVFVEHTLFSWETPDNPGTPGVNEQFEGWTQNPMAGTPTPISITSEGATDGSSALQIDRTGLVSGFSWGNVFGLDAVANPGVQGQIDDLVTRTNGATQIAVDITFEDHPNSPTYTNLWLAITDNSGEYYQGSFPGFDITNADNGPLTQTLVIDIDSLIDTSSNKNLAVEGLVEGTNQLGIILGTGTDGGAIYQIDNFRLISLVEEETGDFDNDGDVDGRDFLIWQRGGSPNPGSASDLALWQAEYNGGQIAAAVAVPEPTTLSVFTVIGLVLAGRVRRA